MGLRVTVQKAVQSAFVAIGDLAVEVNYWQKGDAERSSTRTVEALANFYALNVVFIDFDVKKIDNEAIRRGDVEIYFPASDLEIEPDLADFIEEIDTKVIWNIVNKRLDPASALWILHARKR